jgi:hypothetical protein
MKVDGHILIWGAVPSLSDWGKTTLFLAKFIWEMISGPAIYKTAVLTNMVSLFSQILQAAGHLPWSLHNLSVHWDKRLPPYCKALLHFAEKYAFVVPKYSINFFKCLPFAPFLCQLSFAFHILLKVIAHRDHVIIFDIYTGWHKSLDTRGNMFSIVCQVTSVPACTLYFMILYAFIITVQ